MISEIFGDEFNSQGQIYENEPILRFYFNSRNNLIRSHYFLIIKYQTTNIPIY